MKQFPTLYHKGRSGAVYQWTVWADGSDILTEYGQIGGQMQTSCKKAEGKNIGKANETTPEQQAEIEAQALYKFKLDRKYSETIEACQEALFLPMLAPCKDFADTKKYVNYPCNAQPKLDGVRCLVFWEGDSVKLISRSGKAWDLPHISEQLALVLKKETVLDGELYIHGETFQSITKRLKSKIAGEKETISFHVYDVPVCDGLDLAWGLRYEHLIDFQDDLVNEEYKTSKITVVETALLGDEDEVYMQQAEFLSQGYEGLMLRMMDGMYEWGYRSKSLLKVKQFDDHEFKIVGFSDGKGKNEGTVKWTCELPTGGTFDCAPTGVKADREQMFKDGAAYIGKLLKVKHQGYTEEGVPRFPVGIGFRDEMDLGGNDGA